MSRVILKTVPRSLRISLSQGPRKSMLSYIVKEAVVQRLLPKSNMSKKVFEQSYSINNQKNPQISLEDPSIKSYISNILESAMTEKSGPKFHNWHLLKQLMDNRGKLLENINLLSELSQDKESVELKELAEEESVSYKRELSELDNQILQLLVPRNAHECYTDILVEISSGAGGQEAMLFANELLKLYENYANLRGWSFFVESVDASDIGGIRSASIFIHGAGAFEFMQNEIGVHRVQRVPITSSAGMIHTSTAAVIVMPQPTEVDINLSEKDLHIEVMRASGPGGQNVNKTESAVRIKHLPTGIAVESQESQSQHRNKDTALMKLRTKLFDLEIQKQSREIKATREMQQGNRDRSEKIRTYNFPQNRITDHRCQVTTHSIKEFMEGGSAFHSFLEKLNEQNRKKSFLQFYSSIQGYK